MMTRMLAGFCAVSLAFAATPAWSLDPTLGDVPTGRPPDEIAAQKLLPKVRGELWTKLTQCAVDFDQHKGTYRIRITPEVRALDGKTVTIRGFVLPLDGSDRTQHFLVTRNTPVCLYCPPGEPNEVVEVESERAIAWTNRIVSVTGRLKLINDEEKALFFKVEHAEAR